MDNAIKKVAPGRKATSQDNSQLHYNQPIDKLLSRVNGVRQTGPGKWLARCPGHNDRSPSLGIRETDDGRVLLKCWAGCGVDQITSAVGLSLSDLFPARHGRDFDPMAPKPRRPRFSASELLPLVVDEAMIMAIACKEYRQGRPLSTYDEARVILAEHAILEAWAEVKR